MDTVSFEFAGLLDGRIYPEEGGESLGRLKLSEVAHFSNQGNGRDKAECSAEFAMLTAPRDIQNIF